MPRDNKGQAAIEFLVTYGWAILGVMIVVGALAYFGIFNTQRYVNDACLFGDQMICEDYVAYSDGTIRLTLRNNFGVDIDIEDIYIKSIYGEVNCPPGAALEDIALGYTFPIDCDITTNTIPTNDKLRYRAIVTFNKHDSTNFHNQTGDVIVTVQDT